MRRSLLVGVALGLVGCVGGSGDAPAAVASDRAAYEVRGRVLEPYSEDRLAVRHEAIAGFRSVSGELEPMAEMSMRFPVAAGLGAEQLAPGDLIAFELEVDWSRRPPHRIVALELLPAGTTLALSR